MESLKDLVDKMNIVSFFGGNPQLIWKKLNKKIKEVEREESFCLLSRQRVMGIVVSLDEMLNLFLCGDLPREIRTQRFLNSKTDILDILVKGVICLSLQTEKGGKP